MNRRRSLLLLGGFVAAVVLLGLIVGAVIGIPVVGLVAALVLGGAGAAGVYLYADRVALAQSGAQPAGAAEFPRYHNIVEGLSVAAGIPKPALYVVRDATLNAFATGRDPQHAAVVATTGLLEKLNRIELEGILAQQLSHIRNYDTRVATIVVPVGMVAPPLVPYALSPDREAVADQGGVRLTRYPPGLIAALEKLRSEPAAVGAPGKRATSHLWLASSGSGAHPALERRIAALRDM